jgi:hypothetical protein
MPGFEHLPCRCQPHLTERVQQQEVPARLRPLDEARPTLIPILQKRCHLEVACPLLVSRPSRVGAEQLGLGVEPDPVG